MAEQDGTGTGSKDGTDETETKDGQTEEETEQGTNDKHVELDPKAQALVDKTIKEARDARAELRATKASLKKLEDANKTELQRVSGELEELKKDLAEKQARLDEATIGTQLQETAAKLGFLNPALAISLVPRSDLDVDEDGKVTNADAVLKSIVADNPYLVGKRSANAGSGTRSPGKVGTSINDMIRGR